MKRRIIFFMISLLSCFILMAENPIVAPGIYIADASAHQSKDGKMYLYSSRDGNPKYYCSWSYDVFIFLRSYNLDPPPKYI